MLYFQGKCSLKKYPKSKYSTQWAGDKEQGMYDENFELFYTIVYINAQALSKSSQLYRVKK